MVYSNAKKFMLFPAEDQVTFREIHVHSYKHTFLQLLILLTLSARGPSLDVII